MKTYATSIDLKTYLKCVQFSHDSIETNLDEYLKRNQDNPHKILNDIIVGKIAEFGVYQILKEKYDISEPDLNVYCKNDKSYDSDLKTDLYDIHIKSQTIDQSKIFGKSWSFQKKDSLVHNPSDRDYIVLCLVNSLNVTIMHKGLAKNYLKIYEQPISPMLREKKTVLYYDTIIDNWKK